MPRTARASVGGICYHVLNRGNARAEVFHHDRDYEVFVRLMAQASQRVPMRVLAYCLMPNHFHLALWPSHDGDLGRWMHWLLTAHVCWYRRRYQSSCHIWQGRFKAFPIQQDEHLLGVLRYIERNPVRASLVGRVEEWPWSSTHEWGQEAVGGKLDVGPVPRPVDWLRFVNELWPTEDVGRIRQSVNRGMPHGTSDWTIQTAKQLDLEGTLRRRGRPRVPHK